MSSGTKIALIIGGVLVAVLVVLPLVSGLIWGGQGYYGGGMMGGMMGGFGGWWGMGIGMVLFWGLVIWGIVALAQSSGHHEDSDHFGHGWGAESALDVLKKRYARGEIDKGEYEEKKKDLV